MFSVSASALHDRRVVRHRRIVAGRVPVVILRPLLLPPLLADGGTLATRGLRVTVRGGQEHRELRQALLRRQARERGAPEGLPDLEVPRRKPAREPRLTPLRLLTLTSSDIHKPPR